MVPTLVDPHHRCGDLRSILVVLHRLWITLPLTAVILGWWWLFLVLVPAAYRNATSSDG